MNTLNFMTGLSILLKYKDCPNGYNLGANHDIIYVWATEKPVSEVDLGRLYDLSWFQPEAGRDDNDTIMYDANKSWAARI